MVGALQPWNAKGVEGVHRFLARTYRLVTGELSAQQPDKEQLRLLHATIKKVVPAMMACSMLLASSNSAMMDRRKWLALFASCLLPSCCQRPGPCYGQAPHL